MTNEQIIAEIAIQIYGEDAVMDMINRGIEIPLHTVQGWAVRGPYKIKKGEHGIETRLWKKKNRKNGENDNSENSLKPEFCLCKAYLFCAEQVEKITN